ncbi:hypothetical protein AK812_SmicGene8426 [Symbiodinium microadriaticum]|uniref:Uncharacterized protein n=1 Tax=Symbiodinium microadriaticum TaxID=2951 RepID=A0A1Q9EKV9_SYMMI|nr:hypothetical protein AK812_SmicGene8426 [Symbiodinium microadriaticum]
MAEKVPRPSLVPTCVAPCGAPMAELGTWEAVCRCDLQGAAANGSVQGQVEASAWLSLADAGRCWDLARKIPPHLYAAAYSVYQALQETGEDASLPACIPGAFTALTVVILLWEAHDAPDSLVDTALHSLLLLESSIVAPAMAALGVTGVLDCSAYVSGEGWWPGVVDLRWLRRLTGRLARKRMAWQTLVDTGEEPWHEREVAERQWMKASGSSPGSTGLCLCVMHGEGASTLQSSLQSYQEGGLLELARRRFVAFLSHVELEEAVLCWRRKLAERFGLELLPESAWPEPFIRKRQKFGDPGAAMAACAAACDQEFLLFLEDDFHLVTRPGELVQHRLEAAMFAMKSSEQERQAAGRPGAALLGVHLRHKLFFGPPFYEILTARQHGEAPSPYTAWYFSSDPVKNSFPDNLWEPPFWDSGKECDSDRRSWYRTLQFQRDAAIASEQSRGGPEAVLGDEAAGRVWWCSNGSSVLCTSTAAHRDPFRSLMYSTNPMLFRTTTWRLHIMSYMALLQDLRAVEETITSSYSWRVQPTFELGLSLGLFRHQRIDRRLMPDPDEDPLAAQCMEAKHQSVAVREVEEAEDPEDKA